MNKLLNFLGKMLLKGLEGKFKNLLNKIYKYFYYRYFPKNVKELIKKNLLSGLYKLLYLYV